MPPLGTTVLGFNGTNGPLEGPYSGSAGAPVLTLVAYTRLLGMRLLPFVVVAFTAWVWAGKLVDNNVTFSTPEDWPI